jgi:YVTN family beta-propeller protein
MIALALGLVCIGAICCAADGNLQGKSNPGLRRPVAVVLTDDGRWLFTANRNAGTISVIDTAQKKVTAEIAVGHLLDDLARTPDGRRLVAVAERAGELVVLDRKESYLRVAHRVKVSPSPVSVCIAADGKSCSVASLWTRQISQVALEDSPRVLKTIDLPFAPRRLISADSSRLMVADAYGGRLALVDLERGVVDSVRTLPAHNIRGLAWSHDGKHLLLAHQILHRLGTASRDDIHWGNPKPRTQVWPYRLLGVPLAAKAAGGWFLLALKQRDLSWSSNSPSPRHAVVRVQNDQATQDCVRSIELDHAPKPDML